MSYRQIKPAYTKEDEQIYVYTNSDGVYVGEEESKTLTNKLSEIDIEINKGSQKIEQVTTQLGNKANDADINRTTVNKTVTGSINELHSGLGEVTTQLSQKVNQTNVDFLSGVGRGEIAQKGMLTFVTDDARIQDWTIYKDIFAKNNIGCSTAVVTDKVGSDSKTWLTLDQLKTLQNDFGWEMVSHGRHGNFPTLSNEQLDNELRESREWLIENGFTGYDFLMLPYGFGNSDARVRKFVSKYYKGMRNSENGFNRYPISSYDLRLRWIINSSTVDAITGFAVNTIEHWKALIDKAINEGYWFIIGSHSWEVESWGLQTLLSEIVEYANLKRNEIDIVSFKEAYEKQGNILEQINNNTGSDTYNIYDDIFVLSANGNVKSNIGKTKLLKPNTLSFTSPPADIPKGCISICNITSSNASDFPEGKAGTLISYCFAPNYTDSTNRYYYWQEYHIYGSNRTYTRGAKNSIAWYEFTFTDLQISALNKFNGNTPISDFPTLAITVTPISNETAVLGGLPSNFGGTLTTYKVSSTDYCYQNYKSVSSSNEWTRRATSSTTWSGWERISPIKRVLTTAERNSSTLFKELGDMVFDKTLGKPIWYNGTTWIDATGVIV